MKVNDLLALAESAAIEAGKFLQNNLTPVVNKSDDKDIKLAQDVQSEKIIRDILMSGSDFGFLGEESGFAESEKNSFWVVDPIDGTMNFSRGVPLACISIALWANDKPVLGVIYDFNHKEMFSAIVGEGAWLNGDKLMYKPVQKNQAVLATGFTTYMDYSDSNISGFINNIKEYKKIRMIGSAALSLAYVSCGRFDAYMEKDIKLWDVAAGLVMIEALNIPNTYSFTDDRFSMNVKCGA
jgi:myo-inositol-1(or 4)-monophosphatase